LTFLYNNFIQCYKAFNRESDLVEDGAAKELAIGHSRFNQSLPTALDESKRVKLSIAEKWED
jgi:hypothetical protein